MWDNTTALALYGGVGVPVGLTVFKTAGGSLGAAPGGFDSHTPLPIDIPKVSCALLFTRGFTENSGVTQI